MPIENDFVVIPSGVEIFVALDPVDLRWGFDRLAGIAEMRLGGKTRSGALFVFFGKRHTALKGALRGQSGVCVFCQRLDRGRHRVPERATRESTSVMFSERELDDLPAGSTSRSDRNAEDADAFIG